MEGIRISVMSSIKNPRVMKLVKRIMTSLSLLICLFLVIIFASLSIFIHSVCKDREMEGKGARMKLSEYQVLRYHPQTKEVSVGFSSSFAEIEEDKYLSYESDDGFLNLYSNIGMNQFITHGTCDYDRQKQNSEQYIYHLVSAKTKEEAFDRSIRDLQEICDSKYSSSRRTSLSEFIIPHVVSADNLLDWLKVRRKKEGKKKETMIENDDEDGFEWKDGEPEQEPDYGDLFEGISEKEKKRRMKDLKRWGDDGWEVPYTKKQFESYEEYKRERDWWNDESDGVPEELDKENLAGWYYMDPDPRDYLCEGYCVPRIYKFRGQIWEPLAENFGCENIKLEGIVTVKFKYDFPEGQYHVYEGPHGEVGTELPYEEESRLRWYNHAVSVWRMRFLYKFCQITTMEYELPHPWSQGNHSFIVHHRPEKIVDGAWEGALCYEGTYFHKNVKCTRLT